MTAISRLRRMAVWIAKTLETSATGCYAVGEFAVPWAEFQGMRIASPDHASYRDVARPHDHDRMRPAHLRHSHALDSR